VLLSALEQFVLLLQGYLLALSEWGWRSAGRPSERSSPIEMLWVAHRFPPLPMAIAFPPRQGSFPLALIFSVSFGRCAAPPDDSTLCLDTRLRKRRMMKI
jgi:hypothetical protein